MLRPPDSGFLVFRIITEEHAEDIYRLNSDPRVVAYTGEKPWTWEETEGFIRYQKKQKHPSNRRFMVYVNNEAAGIAGFRLFDDSGLPAISFRFFPDCWGQGIATLCVSHLTLWGTGPPGFDKIQAQVHLHNVATHRVLEKCGYRMEELFSWEGSLWQRWLYTV